MVRRYAVDSPESMRGFGYRIGAFMYPGAAVLLVGGLGIGKSVLARGIASGLGTEGPMPSPTYALANTYSGRCLVHHCDLYRLEREGELYAAGMDEIFSGDAVAIVEWADKFPLPVEAYVRAEIERGAREDSRIISLRTENIERESELHGALGAWGFDEDIRR